jgi:ABC-type amino acid transport substrate-binding protein
MQSIYNYKTHIRKITITVKKRVNKLTDSVKYDFSDLQIIQTHGNKWGFHDLAAALVFI